MYAEHIQNIPSLLIQVTTLKKVQISLIKRDFSCKYVSDDIWCIILLTCMLSSTCFLKLWTHPTWYWRQYRKSPGSLFCLSQQAVNKTHLMSAQELYCCISSCVRLGLQWRIFSCEMHMWMITAKRGGFLADSLICEKILCDQHLTWNDPSKRQSDL